MLNLSQLLFVQNFDGRSPMKPHTASCVREKNLISLKIIGLKDFYLFHIIHFEIMFTSLMLGSPSKQNYDP